MEFYTALHGFLGTILLVGLMIAIWEASFPRGRSLRVLQVNTIVMTVAVLIIDLVGDLIYVRYRMSDPSSARSLILAGNKPWVHNLLMEMKEHVAHFVPLILLVVVAIVFVYDIRKSENSTARKVVITLLSVSFVVTLLVLLMGAIVTNQAPIR